MKYEKYRKKGVILIVFLLLFTILSLNTFAVLCTEKEQIFDGRCYDCDPESGYLKFNPNDRSVLCMQCNLGFKLNKETKKCELMPIEVKTKNINVYIDQLTGTISKAFKTDNLLVGYAVIVIALLLLGYYGIQYLRGEKMAGKGLVVIIAIIVLIFLVIQLPQYFWR